MSTSINIVIDDTALKDLNLTEILARRQSKDDKAKLVKAAETAKKEKDEESKRQAKEQDGKPDFAINNKKVKSRIEPIGPVVRLDLGYWLVVRPWTFEQFSDRNDLQNNLLSGVTGPADIAKIQVVTISGAGASISYTTIAERGNSVLNLLNGRDSSTDTYRGFFGPVRSFLPYLPPGTPQPSDPYVIQGTGPRKTLENAEPGASEFDPEKYTLLHNRQLPIRIPFTTTLSFTNIFYNIYQETLEDSVIYLSCQPKKITSSGRLSDSAPKIHGEIFDGNDSNFSDVNHAYLAGKHETGTVTVKPKNTNTEFHVFVTGGFDRNGAYSLQSSGNSRFSIGSRIYWQNYALFQLEPDVYRTATISSVSRGTFTYSNNTDGTRSFTGLRIVIDLTDNPVLTLPFANYEELFNSSIIATFSDVEEALESEDTVWFDTYRLAGGFLNEWVIKTFNNQTIAQPPVQAKYVGDVFSPFVYQDCSKAGKSYLVAAVDIAKDNPLWRQQLNYVTSYPPFGDIVIQRPALTDDPSVGQSDLQINATFIELDCASNSILRSENATVNYESGEEYYEAIARIIPGWFPSKRYREAGYFGSLNLNQEESERSFVGADYNPDTGLFSYYVGSYSLDQSLSIDEIIGMIADPDNLKKQPITSDAYEGRNDIDINEYGEYIGPPLENGADLGSSAPSRWSTTYSEGFFVSL